MTKLHKVMPVTPDGKRYEKRYYSDSGRHEIQERPTTSSYSTSLRERHGFRLYDKYRLGHRLRYQLPTEKI